MGLNSLCFIPTHLQMRACLLRGCRSVFFATRGKSFHTVKPGLKQSSKTVFLPGETASTTPRERTASTKTSFMMENVSLRAVHMHTARWFSIEMGRSRVCRASTLKGKTTVGTKNVFIVVPVTAVRVSCLLSTGVKGKAAYHDLIHDGGGGSSHLFSYIVICQTDSRASHVSCLHPEEKTTTYNHNAMPACVR